MAVRAPAPWLGRLFCSL